MKKALFTIAVGGCCFNLSAQNLIDNYLTGTPTYTVIAGGVNQVSQPRDLDFKPNTNELWVINRGNSNGGSTVIIYNAGETNQTSQFRQDSHSGHFMIFPSGIAFGDNGEFANTNEIMNTSGPGSTFMGPALWSSDTSIYARVFQSNWVNGRPLGSHLDMLHQSPFSMGIAHDSASLYWVFDGHNGNLCKYDFGMHHSPGYDDHSNGKIWRYTDVPLTRVSNMPGHMIKDKVTGWLYIVDAGTKKLKRVNTNTGSISGTLNVPSSGGEPLNGYWAVTGATVQVLDSFNSSQPSGIDLYNGRMIVGDNSNGNIHVYDITGTTPVKLGVIATGQTGMMGLKIGHDGKIWFVNSTQSTVVRIDPTAMVNNDLAVAAITAPILNNFDPHFYHPGFNQCNGSIAPVVTINNTGSNVISSATIMYKVDNGTWNSFSWSGTLAPNATTSVTLPASTVGNGSHKLTVEVMNVNGGADANPANNTKEGSFRKFNPQVSFPFSEHFSNPTFPPANWTYLSHNFHNEMSHTSAVGGGALKMENYSNAENITGQRDYLLTPRIDLTNATTTANLSFSVAYARRDLSSNDALTINVSTDCGQTWSQVYQKSGGALATTSNFVSGAFTPGSSDWRSETVSLSSYAGMQNVIIQFLTTSSSGNNLYLDDINISNTTSVAGVDAKRFAIYPNPVKDMLVIDGLHTNKPLTVTVFDMTGKRVMTLTNNDGQEKLTMNIADLNSGIYIVKIASGEQTQQEKITIID
ncbi:MAG TPA: T9SS type A sorting domain-containing protein [Flavipsychrobacter sp.]|nr:T9SS type A sorting domain-containing protein [Flavipsychrobacter sp.]